MSAKRFLSNKRTAIQTISLSPALKDWVERYVHVNQNRNPEDVRFKSVSSFYAYIIENLMLSFQKGKSLNDFSRFISEDNIFMLENGVYSTEMIKDYKISYPGRHAIRKNKFTQKFITFAKTNY